MVPVKHASSSSYSLPLSIQPPLSKSNLKSNRLYSRGGTSDDHHAILKLLGGIATTEQGKQQHTL
uniref:Uncharacterized protein n=1 Tax=Arundo donax TaxID=35708 RepID=A0A0A9EXT4_ARUDO